MNGSGKASSSLDPQAAKFLTHLAADRGASVYTQRNYRQALTEFIAWHQQERKSAPDWAKLQRDDFRKRLDAGLPLSLSPAPSSYSPVNNDGGKSWIGGYRAERNQLLKFIKSVLYVIPVNIFKELDLVAQIMSTHVKEFKVKVNKETLKD